MGVKNSERCETGMEYDYGKKTKEEWDFYCRKDFAKTRCRNKAVRDFGSMYVCLDCWEAMEKGFQKQVKEWAKEEESSINMKDIKRNKVTGYQYRCPYCEHDFGIIDGADYHFERVVGTTCPSCNKEFNIPTGMKYESY